MADIIAMAVSAAGSVAGGEAAQAIMGNPTNSDGGGTPGVTTTQSSGKNDKMAGIPQVDPTQALNYFKQAGNVQAQGYQQGLTYFTSAISQARNQINAGMNTANATLTPLSSASNAALNQELQMMGMAPVSATAGSASLAAAAGVSPAIQAQITAANSIVDPTQRAAAQQQIQGALTSAQTAFNPQSVISQIGPRPNTSGTPYDAQTLAQNDPTGSKAQFNNTLAANQQAATAWDQQYNTLVQQGQAANKTQNQAIQQFASNYANSYSPTAQTGYTPNQASQILSQTPGYQFALNQGTEAIARQSAASGMLGSANVQAALTSYGQGLANTTYNSYMSNLANIANQGAGATSQIAANQVNNANSNATLTTALGTQQNTTSNNIANAQAQALTNEGNLVYNAAQYNTGLQNQTFMANNAQQAQASNVATSSAAGLLNAATTANNSNSYGQYFAANNAGVVSSSSNGFLPV